MKKTKIKPSENGRLFALYEMFTLQNRLFFFGFAEDFFMLLIDFVEIGDVAFIEAAAVFCDIGGVGLALFFHSGKVVCAVNSPAVEEANLDSIGRAEEGATHTHIAVMMELDFAVFAVDIIVGTSLYA